jgi:hypothetical protein
VFSGVFIAEEDDELGYKRSENTTVVDVHTHLEAFMNINLRPHCLFDKVFSGTMY